ncbi:MAG TPA: RecQ family ATP-dependent DNA helicase, partial [Planctomycetota bacterium]|nr:RecQ family ATP-dependent DNA helicase [Planctomycetota bacterium]
QILRDTFAHDDFLPGQRAVIEHLLAGRSALAIFPTGGGKSLCYQLPALLLEGLTLVVSPLTALMIDQEQALSRRGVAVARLDSTLTVAETREVYAGLREHGLRILYVTPERFLNERFREALLDQRVALFAVDEVHCISEWGHNFRPDYLKLAAFARACGAERVLGLTATATVEVEDDIRRELGVATDCVVRTGFYRSNLTLLTTPVSPRERDALLLSRLRDRPPGPTLVYVTLKRTAEEVARRLADEGFPARPYHAGLDGDDRARIQAWFMRSKRGIVVATIAFGMGIDKRDIRYVYHYNLPKSLEGWSQEMGRAGRDGRRSICEVFASTTDLTVLESFAYGDTPTRRAVRSLIREIFEPEDSEVDVRVHQLAARHDIRPLVIRTLLTYLELEGWISGGAPFCSVYRFRPEVERREILSRCDGETRSIVEALFEASTRGRTWLRVDVDRAADAAGVSRPRMVRAIDWLASHGLVEVEIAGATLRFAIERRPDGSARLDELASSLAARFERREAREIRRLDQVIGLIAKDGCQGAALAAHFGETLEKGQCGQCSWCLGAAQPIVLPPPPPVSIDEPLWRKALRLRARYPDVLGESRSFARFLCGLQSPRITWARLGSHELFGALRDVPFAELVARADGGSFTAEKKGEELTAEDEEKKGEELTAEDEEKKEEELTAEDEEKKEEEFTAEDAEDAEKKGE